MLEMNLQCFAEDSESEMEVTDSSGAQEMSTEESEEQTEETTEEDAVETTETQDEESTEETEGVEEEQKKEVQSKSDNSKYAAARRDAEMKAKQVIKSRDAEYERRFGNFKNPITNQPIKSEKDYLDALDAQQKMASEAELKKHGINPNLINAMVQNSPQVKELAAMKQRMELEDQQKKYAEGLEFINKEVREISKLDPTIKTSDDLDKLDKIEDIVGLCKEKGLTPLQAYKQVYFDDIMSRQTSKIKQGAINQVKGKEHLKQVGGVKTKGKETFISEKSMETYRDYYPDLSDSEIKKKVSQIS